jgi:hypothetical protein
MSENLAAFKPSLPFYEKLHVVVSFSILTTEQTQWRFSFRITNLSKKHVENSVITCLLRSVTRNFKIQCVVSVVSRGCLQFVVSYQLTNRQDPLFLAVTHTRGRNLGPPSLGHYKCYNLLSFVGYRYRNRNSCALQDIWELRLLEGSWNAWKRTFWEADIRSVGQEISDLCRIWSVITVLARARHWSQIITIHYLTMYVAK